MSSWDYATHNDCAFCHQPITHGNFHEECARGINITNSDGGYINSSDEGASAERAKFVSEGVMILREARMRNHQEISDRDTRGTYYYTGTRESYNGTIAIYYNPEVKCILEWSHGIHGDNLMKFVHEVPADITYDPAKPETSDPWVYCV